MNQSPAETIRPSLAEMGLLEHLRELRSRLFYAVLAVLVGAIVAYSWSSQLFFFLSKPYFDAFPDAPLIGTGPAEAFVLKLKVAIFAGALLALPVLFYQIWAFVAPGLYPTEKRLVLPFVIASTLCFLVGVWFCYTLVFPMAFSFFSEQYASVGLSPTIRMSENLVTVLQGLLAFGLIFETPVLTFLFARCGLITDRTLIAGWRYIIVIIFVISAVLTPPDVLTQFLMAVPLLGLFALSILIARYSGRNSTPEGEN